MSSTRRRAPASERRYSSSNPEDTNSGAPLGASCSGEGIGWRTLRMVFRAVLRVDFLVATRFAGFPDRAFLAFFFDVLAAVLRVFFAAAFLTFRFAFLAISLSVQNFSVRRG
jgi:hypothetical protein